MLRRFPPGERFSGEFPRRRSEVLGKLRRLVRSPGDCGPGRSVPRYRKRHEKVAKTSRDSTEPTASASGRWLTVETNVRLADARGSERLFSQTDVKGDKA